MTLELCHDLVVVSSTTPCRLEVKFTKVQRTFDGRAATPSPRSCPGPRKFPSRQGSVGGGLRRDGRSPRMRRKRRRRRRQGW